MARREDRDGGMMTLMPEMSRAQRVCRRFEQLQSEKGPTEAICQQIADYVVGRGDFSSQSQTDRRRDYYIYDNTSINSSNMLAAGLFSILFPGQFFALSVEDEDLMDDEDVQWWLDDSAKRMHAEIMRPEANFESQAHEMIKDLVDFGTSGLVVDDVPGKGVRFAAVPLGQLYLGEDGYGRVDTVFPRFYMTNWQIWERWGEGIADPVLRESFRDRAAKHPDEKRYIIHGIEPTRASDVTPLGKQKNFVGTFVDQSTKTELETRFFDDLPIATPRSEKIPGIAYGNCPGRYALPAQMMLNEMERTMMEWAQKAVSPPLLVPNDGSMVQLNRDPDGVISYNPDMSSQRGPGVEYLESRSNFNPGFEMMESRKNDVRQAYHYEIQGVFAHSEQYRTATQVVALAQKATELMGPNFKRVQGEGITPVLNRVFLKMLQGNRLADAPMALQGSKVKLHYISPAEKAMLGESADSIRRFRLSCMEIAEIEPDAKDVCDFEMALRKEAEALGITASSEVIRSKKAVAIMRQARNEVSEENAEMQDMLQASQVVKNVAPAMKLTQGGQAA